jgi:nucleotide-binding universal stress UspA family protein
MRALIATDLSEASLAAVDAVTSCNPVDFSGIVLVHAVDLDLYTAGGTVPAVLELAEESLGSIAEDLRTAGFEVSVRAEVGPAVEVIERVAAEENADLVVMSNLGKGAVTGRLLGSTAERLATAGKLPVLIERVRRTPASGAGSQSITPSARCSSERTSPTRCRVNSLSSATCPGSARCVSCT